MSERADPDLDMVFRLRQGDEDALREIIRRYQGPIHDFAFRMLGTATRAEDAAQEVFVRVNSRIASFRPDRGLFSTWIFQIARNTAIDELRRRKHDPIHAADEIENDHAARSPSPTEQLAQKEIGHAIATAMADLPEDQRTAIALAEYHDLSYAEIAAIMDCSEKSVEARIYRAKEKLRKHLREFLKEG